jgi:hypothetical protein
MAQSVPLKVELVGEEIIVLFMRVGARKNPLYRTQP